MKYVCHHLCLWNTLLKCKKKGKSCKISLQNSEIFVGKKLNLESKVKFCIFENMRLVLYVLRQNACGDFLIFPFSMQIQFFTQAWWLYKMKVLWFSCCPISIFVNWFWLVRISKSIYRKRQIHWRKNKTNPISTLEVI